MKVWECGSVEKTIENGRKTGLKKKNNISKEVKI